MFLANNLFELPALPSLEERSDRSFRAIELAAREPWFLVTLPIDDRDRHAPHSICCAWAWDVLGLISSRAHRNVLAVQAVLPQAESLCGWTIKDINRVWLASDRWGHEVMVFEDVDGERFMGAHASLPTGLTQWQLVFEVIR